MWPAFDQRDTWESPLGTSRKNFPTLDTQGLSSSSRHALSNMIATRHRWLFKIKLIEIKNLIPQSH